MSCGISGPQRIQQDLRLDRHLSWPLQLATKRLPLIESLVRTLLGRQFDNALS